MINFNKLEPNKLYRTRTTYTLPYNPKSQSKGYMTMVFGESINDTIEYIDVII